MIKFLKQIWEHRQFIIGGLFILFIVLFIRQCNETANIKYQLDQSRRIAEQNIAALKDSSIQLRMTREQLSALDSNLNSAISKIDSLEKIKSKVITIVIPKYINKEVIVPNELAYDSIQNNHGLKFASTDSIRTIKGVSWFGLREDKDKLTILPKNTQITDFQLNFGFLVSQYLDEQTNYVRTKIQPVYLNEKGDIDGFISPNVLNIKFRNIEILDRPNTPTASPDVPPPPPSKFIHTGFGISISPVAIGLYPGLDGKYTVGFTPNIGISYNITFNKK